MVGVFTVCSTFLLSFVFIGLPLPSVSCLSLVSLAVLVCVSVWAWHSIISSCRSTYTPVTHPVINACSIYTPALRSSLHQIIQFPFVVLHYSQLSSVFENFLMFGILSNLLSACTPGPLPLVHSACFALAPLRFVCQPATLPPLSATSLSQPAPAHRPSRRPRQTISSLHNYLK